MREIYLFLGPTAGGKILLRDAPPSWEHLFGRFFMRTGLKFAKFAGMIFLCVACLSALSGASAHAQRKTKKPPLAPLPNGPTGPVPQIPLDSIAAVPPQVTYQNGLLTITAANSTLGDILRAVKKQTGADIEVPAAHDRVVTNLGPGS